MGGTFCAHGHSTLLGVEMFLKREVIVPKDDPEEVPCHVFPTGGRGSGKDSLEGHLDPRLLHRIFSTRNYCIRSNVPIDHAQYQG